jgi:ABC-type antimicrobial peptide transport system permease subunit
MRLAINSTAAIILFLVGFVESQLFSTTPQKNIIKTIHVENWYAHLLRTVALKFGPKKKAPAIIAANTKQIVPAFTTDTPY